MGIFLSKQKKMVYHPPPPPPNFNLKLFIEQYEYIKHTKQIYDIDKIIVIIQNTNWEQNVSNIIPSAPPTYH